MKKYYSETFEKIPGEKSERILRLSLEEFRRRSWQKMPALPVF